MARIADHCPNAVPPPKFFAAVCTGGVRDRIGLLALYSSKNDSRRHSAGQCFRNRNFKSERVGDVVWLLHHIFYLLGGSIPKTVFKSSFLDRSNRQPLHRYTHSQPSSIAWNRLSMRGGVSF